MRTVQDYVNRITPWLAGKPKFNATVAALVTPFVELQAFLDGVPLAFDLDTAIGHQLDVCGAWIGFSRIVDIPITGVYFSWGSSNLGWGQGSWRAPFDPVEGKTELDDDTYRTMLRIKIAANSWDGTVGSAATALSGALKDYPETILFILDNQNMTMNIGISGALPPVILQELLLAGYLPFKPAGVKLTFGVTTTNGAPVFGWGANASGIAGWGIGAWATTNQTSGGGGGGGTTGPGGGGGTTYTFDTYVIVLGTVSTRTVRVAYGTTPVSMVGPVPASIPSVTSLDGTLVNAIGQFLVDENLNTYGIDSVGNVIINGAIGTPVQTGITQLIYRGGVVYSFDGSYWYSQTNPGADWVYYAQDPTLGSLPVSALSDSYVLTMGTEKETFYVPTGTTPITVTGPTHS